MTRPAPRSARAVPTMRDVATLAGVSVMTVSRVLHDDPRITEDTKSRSPCCRAGTWLPEE